MKTQITLEVCANSVDSAVAAQEGGAARIELCDNLHEGGTTPSYGNIELARERLTIDLYVLIRPRGGDFLYSENEFEVMKRDIRISKELGTDGIVLGILKHDGNIDKERSKELIDLARPLSVTFHRAFDMTPDPNRALEDIIDVGADRILTSGQANKAIDGMEVLASIVRRAGNRINIMAGSGVNTNNILKIMTYTHAREFHVSGRKLIESVMIYQNPKILMGGNPTVSEYEKFETDSECIKSLLQTVEKHCSSL